MAFTEKLETRRPRTAAEAYDLWLSELPDAEGRAVESALRNRNWTNPELKPILEEDEDYPAPVFGMTTFREWRAEFLG